MQIDTNEVKKQIKEKMQLEIVPKWMKNFFSFRTMLFPLIIKIIFLISTIIAVISGVNMLFNGKVIPGLGLIFLYPIATHLLVEFIMLFFSMLDVQKSIDDELKAIRAELAAKNDVK